MIQRSPPPTTDGLDGEGRDDGIIGESLGREFNGVEKCGEL